MKNFILSRLFIFSLLLLTSCEVLKTTPRSSPDYRGPGSGHRYTGPSKKSAPPARTTARKTTTTNRQTTAASAKTAPRTTPDRPAPAVSKEAPRAVYTPSRRSVNSDAPEVVQIARSYTGTPYRSGGNDKEGIDCSGLICQIYSEMGFKVPRVSWQQSEFGREVEQIKDIKPGDWIFFVPEGGREGYVSHSGIVTEVRGESDIVFIHASSSRGVVEDNLFSNYFRNRFVKAMRPF